MVFPIVRWELEILAERGYFHLPGSAPSIPKV